MGLPWKGSQIRVLDLAREPAAPGQQGLVYMKMGTSTFSYYHDEEKTRRGPGG